MRILLLVLLLSAIALAVFNPGAEQFEQFVENQSEKVFQEKTGDSELGRALSGIGSAITGSLARQSAERKNYLLFSTYTIDLDGPEETADDWRFLGIAGQFIELQRPASMQEGEGGM